MEKDQVASGAKMTALEFREYNMRMPVISHATRTVSSVSLFVLLLASAAMGQTPQDVLHSFVDQKLILRHIGDADKTKITKKELAGLKGTCDKAVQVNEASWGHGTARFKLDEIGHPGLTGRSNNCKYTHEEITVEISGFNSNESPDLLAKSLGELLQTPDQYLATNGIPSAPPPASDGKVTESSLSAVTAPKILLSVDPVYSREASKGKYQGKVVLRVTIGTDGRIQEASVTRGTGKGLDENALRIVSMWRFEPARKLNEPIAYPSNLEINFETY